MTAEPSQHGGEVEGWGVEHGVRNQMHAVYLSPFFCFGIGKKLNEHYSD